MSQNSLKLILCGPSGAGKSTFFARCFGKEFQTLSPVSPTIGVDMNVLKFNTPGGKTYELQIWDTAGQERHMSLTASFFRNTDVCLLFVDLSDTTTEIWESRHQEADHWLKSVRKKTDSSCKVIIIGTKRDASSHFAFRATQNKQDSRTAGFVVIRKTDNPAERHAYRDPAFLNLVDSFSPICCTSSKIDSTHCFQKFLLGFCEVPTSRPSSTKTHGSPVAPNATAQRPLSLNEKKKKKICF